MGILKTFEMILRVSNPKGINPLLLRANTCRVTGTQRPFTKRKMAEKVTKKNMNMQSCWQGKDCLIFKGEIATDEEFAEALKNLANHKIINHLISPNLSFNIDI
jgi:hypothetical protein